MKKTIEVLAEILKQISVDKFWAIDISENDICFCADYNVTLRREIERVLRVKLKLNVKNNWYTGEMMRGRCKIRVIVWNDDK